jgi:hypothetical protein
MAIYAVKYNPSGEYIPGATQVGTLAVAIGDVDYTTGGWIGGVDDDLGYVIYSDTTSLNLVGRTTASFSANLVQPNMPTFYRSKFKTDESLLELINRIPGNTQSFNDINSAKAWLGETTHANVLGGTYSGGGATGSSDFNVTITQVGDDVVWSGSGSFNLGALTSTGTQPLGAGFQASQAIWVIGDSTPPGPNLDTYSGVTTFPTSFGTDSGVFGTPSGSGDTFGILPDGFGGRSLYVPLGYVSGSPISNSTTYAGTTITGMNLTTGTYTWIWGTGGNTSTLVMIIG